MPSIQRQQFPQRLFLGNASIPPVPSCDGVVESSMRIGKPLWPGIVEVRQGALLEFICRSMVAGRSTVTLALEA